MTLIAAFEFVKLPVLVGDFQLTYRDGSLAGTRKKVCILSDNLALGWTGSLAFAELALDFLSREVNEQVVDKDLLTSLLCRLDEIAPEQGELKLIGWIVDQRHICFNWSSKLPFSVKFSNHAYAGSGESVCLQVFGPSGPNVDGVKLQNQADIDCFLMSLIANLVREEKFSDADINKGLGFGFSFECILHDGVKFDYFSNLAFLKVCAFFDQKGEIESMRLDDKFMTYFASGSQSCVAITNLAMKNTDLHMVSTPGVSKRLMQEHDLQRMVREFKNLTLNYRMYFIFFELRSEELCFDNVVLPIPAAEAGGLISVNGNQLTLSLGSEVVKLLFQTMKKGF